MKKNSIDLKAVELSEAFEKEDVFDLIGKQWMLVTAGDKDSFNTMTASLPGSKSALGLEIH